MFYIALYVGIVVIGYFAGSILRNKDKKIEGIGKITFGALLILIFVMGIKLGADDKVIAGFKEIGLTALVTAVFALAGTILFVFIARNLVGIDRKGVRKSTYIDRKDMHKSERDNQKGVIKND